MPVSLKTPGQYSCLLLLILLSGCVTQRAALPDEWPQLEKLVLTDTPFYPQSAYQCGPASLASILQSSGIPVTPDQLTKQVYLPQRQGSLQLDLIGATRRNGRIPYQLPPNIMAIRNELMQSRPVLIMQNLGLRNLPRMHYAVVIGMTPSTNEIILHSDTRKNLSMDVNKFLRSWDLADRWAIVSLKPGELPADNDPLQFIKAVAGYAIVTKDSAVLKSHASAVKRWPDYHLAWFSYAVAQQASGNPQDAIRYYRQSLLISPDYVPSRNNLALLYAEAGNYDQALNLLDHLPASDPTGNLTTELEATRNQIVRMMQNNRQ